MRDTSPSWVRSPSWIVPTSLEQLGELTGGHRAGEVEALRDVAAERAQRVHVLLALDALGDDGEAEVVAEVDGGAHQDGVLLRWCVMPSTNERSILSSSTGRRRR